MPTATCKLWRRPPLVYLGGMPLRLLVGYRPELIATALQMWPIAEDQVLLVGARDLDPPEAAYLAGARIGLIPDIASTGRPGYSAGGVVRALILCGSGSRVRCGVARRPGVVSQIG
jgi:hypothetical protein